VQWDISHLQTVTFWSCVSHNPLRQFLIHGGRIMTSWEYEGVHHSYSQPVLDLVKSSTRMRRQTLSEGGHVNTFTKMCP